ncbi:MAG TPA: cytochrome c biogenesis protein CcsA [Arenicellales bacterium]|nr:cytochrome c biogenesis protein CcsA [Arenicellales bacterium]
MLTPILSLGAGGLYLGAGALLIKHLWGSQLASLRPVFALAASAVVLHGLLLYLRVFPASATINVGFTNAASLSAWIVAVIFLAAALVRPAYELGAMILPVAGLSVLAAWLWPPAAPQGMQSTGLTIHLLISLVAYGFLALAVVQSIVMSLQDHRLRIHSEASVLRKLPPLETMEELLFQFIGIGFALLSLGLVTGFWFSVSELGAAFVLNHHTVLSLAAWLIFGSLLVGHFRFGWRGRTATRWTIGGFVVLALAYFGWKFVLEFILNRR